MLDNLGELAYQLDFKTGDKIPHQITNWISENSTRVQHLLDEEPRVTRWWFKNMEIAFNAIIKMQEQEEFITYRLICLTTNSLYIQHGEFE